MPSARDARIYENRGERIYEKRAAPVYEKGSEGPAAAVT